ncbi:MAG: hypothetical protein J5574_04060 [Lachnospiraceae bacterium]|nr:hypothetical protein [Lachnospiraceae bacterium]
MIRNRLTLLYIAAVVAALSLCGCKEEKVDTSGFEKLKDKMEQQAVTEEPEEKEPESATEEESEPAGLFAKAFADGQVENNGGMFVRVGDRVYYRVYSPRAVELTVIGYPSVDEVDADQPSKLMYYDLDAEKSVEVSEVKGIGNLYATVDGICIDSYPDGSHSTTVIDENGEVNEHYLDGNITGVSDDGRSVVIGESDENDSIIPCLYRDGKKIGNPNEGGSKERFSSLGFAGDCLISGRTSEDYNSYSVYSYLDTDETIKLGDVEPFDMETYTLSPIVEDMVSNGRKGYITVAFRDGTANALTEWRIYSFDAGKPGSLEIFKEGGPAEEYDYEIPKVNAGGDYAPYLSSHVVGDVYLSEGTWGDLMGIAPDCKKVLIRENYVSKPDEMMTYMTNIENGYCFSNNAAFFHEVSGQRSPDEDIGWRWAYELIEIDYRMFRFDKDHTDEKGWPQSEILEYLRSVGWNKGDIGYDRLVGEWKADSYNVEGEFRIAEQENGVNDEMIRFDEDGNALIYFKGRASGKISHEKLMHRAGEDEFMGGDYAYIYHSEDEDPLRAGVAYISHNVLKINYLYHFDGNSTGWYEIRYKRAN